MAKYFLDSKISAYGEANGFVDLAALAANFPHISCRGAELLNYEMELKNGSEYYYYDNDGNSKSLVLQKMREYLRREYKKMSESAYSFVCSFRTNNYYSIIKSIKIIKIIFFLT